MKSRLLPLLPLRIGVCSELSGQAYLKCSPFPNTISRQFSKSRFESVESRELERFNQPHDYQSKRQSELVHLAKEKQSRTPWHRQDADAPPVRRNRSAGAMVKGKLHTTPSRLLKLVMPLTTRDHNDDRKTIEPLALLVHPHQPLSYLERLIQSELPTIKTENGNEKIPAVYFKAQSGDENEPEPQQSNPETEQADLEETNIDGTIQKTGVLNRVQHTKKSAGPEPPDSGVEGTETYKHSDRGDNLNEGTQFVRWSPSTDIGDFIRDAARGREFIIEVEGLHNEIRIGVPSFRDRTHFLRQRLRRISRMIAEMNQTKEECDQEAHRAGQRVAILGFGILVFWWVGVYYLTFKTDLGWDTMEPVTYLVGLSSLMMGYLWFLYHNREVSYRAAMKLTISRRQSQLYAARGFNLERWEELIREGNALRAEIKAIASEYDAEWDEAADEHNDKVVKALRKGRDKEKDRQKEEKEEDDVEGDGDDASKAEAANTQKPGGKD